MDLTNKTIEYYNLNAESFVKGSIHANMAEHYARFMPYLPKQASILDLGCGSGRDSAFFMKQGYSVTSVDGSLEVSKLASTLLGIKVRCVLFEDLDYHNEFDGVWACASLLHVPRSEMTLILQKTSEAMKANGVLYVSFKYGNTEEIKGSRFYNNYTEKSITQLFRSSNLICEEYWISNDVRQEHQDEKWLNIIAVKGLSRDIATK